MHALIAIDGSAESLLAVETAASLHWPEGTRLDVLSAVPTDHELYGGPWSEVGFVAVEEVRDRLEAERRTVLDVAVERLRRPGIEVTPRLVVGRAASQIIDVAEAMPADIIILGARGHGMVDRVLLGSVSAEVVDRARVPVLVARRATARRVLVAADGSPDGDAAANVLVRTDLFAGAATRVLTAVDVHPAWWLGFAPGDAVLSGNTFATTFADAKAHAAEVAETTAARLRTTGLTAETVTRVGQASVEILEEAASWGADLVVVGTRGHGTIKRFLIGSTARAVLQRATASVLITRALPVAGERPSAGHDPASAGHDPAAQPAEPATRPEEVEPVSVG